MNITKRSKPSRRIARMIYKWCAYTFGRSKYNGTYPKMIYSKRLIDVKKYYGEYNPWYNRMIIASDIRTTYNLINTIIHEWVHYMQPIKRHLNKINNLDKYTHQDYKNDPYEKEARKLAKKYTEKCFNDLFAND